MNGMIVTVAMKVPVEPRAPRAPSRLSQKPARSSDERPLRDAQEITGAGVAEQWIQPPDQRPVADEGDQSFEFVWKPLLVAEEQKHDHHRGADDVVVEILREQAGPVRRVDQRILSGVGKRSHGRDPFTCEI